MQSKFLLSYVHFKKHLKEYAVEEKKSLGNKLLKSTILILLLFDNALWKTYNFKNITP